MQASRGGWALLSGFLWLLYRLSYGAAALLLACCLPLLGLFKPARAAYWRARLYPQPLAGSFRIWIHAVSLGEAQIGWALVSRLKQETKAQVFMTASTEAGLAFLLKKMPMGQARYLPLDLECCLRRLWGAQKPASLLIVETELWPGLIRFAAKRGTAIALVNGRLGPKSMLWSWVPLKRELLAKMSAIGARGTLDQERFIRCGADASRIRLTGNIKYDYEPPRSPSGPLGAWLAQDGPLLVFASISTDEAEPLAAMVQNLANRYPQLRLLWAPRQLSESDQHLEALKKLAPVLRSELKAGECPRFLILNTLGELAGCYVFARASFVGGSFNRRGGQNFLESLQAGVPVVVGPYTENFRQEVADALAANAIFQVANPLEAEALLARLLDENRLQSEMAQNAEAFVQANRGATLRTLRFVGEMGLLEQTDLENL